MTTFENSSLKIRHLPNTTQSFEEMLEQIAEENSVKDNVTIVSSELFHFSSNYSYEEGHGIEKTARRFISDLTLQNNNRQNISNINCNRDQNFIDETNINTQRNASSSQESLCTECKFGSCCKSFIDSVDNTQRPMQTETEINNETCGLQGCYSPYPAMNKINVISKQRLLSSEQHSFATHIGLKSFSSEGIASTTKGTGIYNCKNIKSTGLVDNFETSKTLIADVKYPLEFVKHNSIIDNDDPPHIAELKIKNFFELSDDKDDRSEKVLQTSSIQNSSDKVTVQSTTDTSFLESDHSSLNQISVSKNRETQEIDSNRGNSILSESTIEEIYYIDCNNEINCLIDVELDGEPHNRSHSLEFNSSIISTSTIEEIYYVDATDENHRLNGVRVSDNKSQREVDEDNSMRNIIDVQEINEDNKITDTPIIDFNRHPSTTKQSDMESDSASQLNVKQDNPGKSNDIKDSAAMNIEAEAIKIQDDLKFQQSVEPQFEKSCNRTENRQAEENNNSTEFIQDVVANNQSIKNNESRNERDLVIPDESFLEISIESETDQIQKPEPIEQRAIKPIHQINHPKKSSTDSKNISSDDKKTRSGPVNSETVNANNSITPSCILAQNVGLKNLKIVDSPAHANTRLLIHTRLEETEIENVTMMKNSNSKNVETSTKHMESPRDDNCLDSLPESELRRMEEEAYEKDNKTDAFAVRNINNNQEDVFYRPERSNIITEKINDDLVLPNWVTNPAPEPNYEKMKHSIQMQRQVIRKMLHEILRLSNLVAKVRSVLFSENRDSVSEALRKSDSEIEEPPSIQLWKASLNNRSSDSRTSQTDIISTNKYSSVITTNSKHSDIFYVPTPPSRSAFFEPNNFLNTSNNRPIKTEARDDTGLINTINSKNELKNNEDDTFYVPPSKRPKYNASPFFNPHSNTKSEELHFSSNYVEANASKIFGSLKRDLNVDRKSGSNTSSYLYTGQKSRSASENKTSNSVSSLKNNHTIERYITTENQLRNEFPRTTLLGKNKPVLNMNNINPVTNDSIFYLPDKLSSASNNYRGSSGIKNDQILFSQNLAKRVSTHSHSDKLRLQNFGGNFDSHSCNNNDSVFYNGNYGSRPNFKMV